MLNRVPILERRVESALLFLSLIGQELGNLVFDDFEALRLSV